MPSMYEIYDSHSDIYDELVSHEDHEGNLSVFLDRNIRDGITVCEAGVGTGRITQLYIKKASSVLCCDRSNHMLERAKQKLGEFENKIRFKELDNQDLGRITEKFDLFVEGWSFGHTITDNKENIEKCLDGIISSLYSIIRNDGKIILIETLGTNVKEPVVPEIVFREYYDLLENRYGFARHVIETDYKFESVNEARRVMGFFFGQTMGDKISSNIVKEYTGIWIKDRNQWTQQHD